MAVIPFSDAARSRTFPYVNIALILTCILVFLYELTLSDVQINHLFRDYGVVPADASAWAKHPGGLHEPATVITAAFLHAGWLHLLGNMIFLWVFGDNVEDALGHVRYLVFYFLAAAGAVALQTAIDSSATVPMIGASGAIAGVLGAYLIFYPLARVSVLIVIIPFPMPAFVLIGLWFLLQLLSGVASLGGDTLAQQATAFWAHVGGFSVGLAVVLLLRPFIHVTGQRPRRYTSG